MKPRRSSIALLTCVGLLIPATVMLILSSESQADRRKSESSGVNRPAKSEGPRPKDPFAAERAETRRAREVLRDDPRLKAIWEGDSLEHMWLTNVMQPFNAAELRRLVNDPHANQWEMTDLLLRAGAEKHAGFQDLLTRPELRKDPSMNMALCAYDYSVNGNRAALEQIVAGHRAAAGGNTTARWNDPAARALAYVDEWDLAKEALGFHPMRPGEADVDGALDFWLTRRYLFPANRDFPKDYEDFTKVLPPE